MHGILDSFLIDLSKLLSCSGEVQKGYFQENPYHNPIHIIDTLQAMHFLFSKASLSKQLKKDEILASFFANLIHDYEHPGYSNAFVIRTKHPLAIRYNDHAVLENHHIAAAYTLLAEESNDFLCSLSGDVQFSIRKTVIEIVLATDLSQHFALLTELKTKLDNNFPSSSSEDQLLMMKLTLKMSDQFKVVRSTAVFFKWMELMFEEFFKQGDMER